MKKDNIGDRFTAFNLHRNRQQNGETAATPTHTKPDSKKPTSAGNVSKQKSTTKESAHIALEEEQRKLHGRKAKNYYELRILCGNSTSTMTLPAITRILCTHRVPISEEQQFLSLSCYMGVHRKQPTSL